MTLRFFGVALLVAVGGCIAALTAQTAPPVTVEQNAVQCTITAKAAFAPTPNTGWSVQFWRQQGTATRINIGRADNSSPYERSTTVAAGTWAVGATWTRSGSATLDSPTSAYTCGTGGGTQPPPTVNAPCTASWVREGAIGETACAPDSTKVVTYRERFVVTVPATGTGACEAANESTREVPVTEKCTYTAPLPPTVKPIWGVVDPTILGSCSAAVHDGYVVDLGYPVRFRTFHRQVDPSGCTFAHEHGMDPASMRNAEIAAEPVAFGHIGWSHKTPAEPNGHEEPHEGFKVFLANVGDVNDEGRINRVWSRSIFHMGTGGPARFTTRHHSAAIRLIHPEFGLKAYTNLMMDTGGSATVCDPRQQSPTKDVMQLNSPCKLNSGYEIWSTQQIVRAPGGKEVYRVFATPAAFDPITVRDPANPTAVVYAWDQRMKASMAFPENDWSNNRGCDRESYAQPGYWYNSGGATIYYTDALGQPLASNAPGALVQEISRSESVGSPATNDGLKQFKMRVSFCQNRGQLGLKN
jgi:hypothetical protein